MLKYSVVNANLWVVVAECLGSIFFFCFWVPNRNMGSLFTECFSHLETTNIRNYLEMNTYEIVLHEEVLCQISSPWVRHFRFCA